MGAIDAVLDKLVGVRRTGRGRWVARCPAHEDRSPSLSIREGDDGRVLLHCFSGCAAADVIGALGIDFRDLFPSRGDANYQLGRSRPAPPIPASDALRLLEREALTVEIVALRLADGDPVEQHRQALHRAASRIAIIHRSWCEAFR